MDCLKKVTSVLLITAMLLPDVSVLAAPAEPARIPLPDLQNAGRIAETFLPVTADRARLILVQDAHGIDEAQRSIEQILRHLKSYGASHLFLEGTLTPLEPERFRYFKNEERNGIVWEHLLAQAVFRGPDIYLASGGGMKTFATEDEKVYEKNLKLFRAVLSKKEEAEETVGSLYAALDGAAARSMEKERLELIRAWWKLHNDRIRLTDFVTAAGKFASGFNPRDPESQSKWPHWGRILILKEIEKRFDKEKIEIEKEAFISKMKELGVEAGLVERLNHLDKEKSVRSLFEQITDALGTDRFPLQYPHFFDAVRYRTLSQEIQAPLLFKDIDSWVEETLVSQAADENERTVAGLFFKLRRLRNLFCLELTSSEWDEITKNPAENSLEGFAELLRPLVRAKIEGRFVSEPAAALFKKAKEFYEITKSRDEILVDKTLAQLQKEKDTGVLISGGFHSDGIKVILKARKIPFIEIIPSIHEVSSAQAYLDRMLRKTPDSSGVASPEALQSVSALRALGYDREYAAVEKTGLSLALAASLGEDAVESPRSAFETEKTPVRAASLGQEGREDREELTLASRLLIGIDIQMRMPPMDRLRMPDEQSIATLRQIVEYPTARRFFTRDWMSAIRAEEIVARHVQAHEGTDYFSWESFEGEIRRLIAYLRREEWQAGPEAGSPQSYFYHQYTRVLYAAREALERNFPRRMVDRLVSWPLAAERVRAFLTDVRAVLLDLNQLEPDKRVYQRLEARVARTDQVLGTGPVRREDLVQLVNDLGDILFPLDASSLGEEVPAAKSLGQEGAVAEAPAKRTQHLKFGDLDGRIVFENGLGSETTLGIDDDIKIRVRTPVAIRERITKVAVRTDLPADERQSANLPIIQDLNLARVATEGDSDIWELDVPIHHTGGYFYMPFITVEEAEEEKIYWAGNGNDNAHVRVFPKWALDGMVTPIIFVKTLRRPGTDQTRFGTFTDLEWYLQDLKFNPDEKKRIPISSALLLPFTDGFGDSPYEAISPLAINPRHIDWDMAGYPGATPQEKFQAFLASAAGNAEFQQFLDARFMDEIRDYADVKAMHLQDPNFHQLDQAGRQRLRDNDHYRYLVGTDHAVGYLIFEQFIAQQQVRHLLHVAEKLDVNLLFDLPFFPSDKGSYAIHHPEYFQHRDDGSIKAPFYDKGHEAHKQEWKGQGVWDYNKLEELDFHPIENIFKYWLDLGFKGYRWDAAHMSDHRVHYALNRDILRGRDVLPIPEQLGGRNDYGDHPYDSESLKWNGGLLYHNPEYDSIAGFQGLVNSMVFHRRDYYFRVSSTHDSPRMPYIYRNVLGFNEGTPIDRERVQMAALHREFAYAQEGYSFLQGDERGHGGHTDKAMRINVPLTKEELDRGFNEWHWDMVSPMDPASERYDLREHLAKLMRVRNENLPLRRPNTLHYIYNSQWGKVSSYVRRLAEETVFVVNNLTADEQSGEVFFPADENHPQHPKKLGLDFSKPFSLRNLETGETVEFKPGENVNGANLKFQLPPGQAYVFRFEHPAVAQAASLGMETLRPGIREESLKTDPFYRALGQGYDTFLSFDQVDFAGGAVARPALYAGGRGTHFGDQEWGRDFAISTLGLARMARTGEKVDYQIWDNGQSKTVPVSARELTKGLIRRWAGVDTPRGGMDWNNLRRINGKNPSGDVMYNVINWYGDWNFNTVDAPLWFIETVFQYVDATGDTAFLEETMREGQTLLDVIWEIIDRYKMSRAELNAAGINERSIQMDPATGFILIPRAKYTWMDTEFTHRQGYPVEIQALWYNALERVGTMAMSINQPRAMAALELSEKVKKNFPRFFWNEADGALYDVLGTDGVMTAAESFQRGWSDPAIRANQIFAVYFRLIEGEHAKQVLQSVHRHLLIPGALRSLKPGPTPFGEYFHDFEAAERAGKNKNAAYHSGLGWVWLYPFYFLSAVDQGVMTPEAAEEQMRRDLEPIQQHNPAKSLPELLSGEPYGGIHAQRGPAAQAWSVATVIFALHELRRREDVTGASLGVSYTGTAKTLESAFREDLTAPFFDNIRSFRRLAEAVHGAVNALPVKEQGNFQRIADAIDERFSWGIAREVFKHEIDDPDQRFIAFIHSILVKRGFLRDRQRAALPAVRSEHLNFGATTDHAIQILSRISNLDKTGNITGARTLQEAGLTRENLSEFRQIFGPGGINMGYFFRHQSGGTLEFVYFADYDTARINFLTVRPGANLASGYAHVKISADREELIFRPNFRADAWYAVDENGHARPVRVTAASLGTAQDYYLRNVLKVNLDSAGLARDRDAIMINVNGSNRSILENIFRQQLPTERQYALFFEGRTPVAVASPSLKLFASLIPSAGGFLDRQHPMRSFIEKAGYREAAGGLNYQSAESYGRGLKLRNFTPMVTDPPFRDVPATVFPGVYHPWHDRSSSAMLETMRDEIEPGMEVFIIGYGPGQDARYAALRGANVSGTDVNEAAYWNTRYVFESDPESGLLLPRLDYLGVNEKPEDIFKGVQGRTFHRIFANLPSGAQKINVAFDRNFHDDPERSTLTTVLTQSQQHLKPGGKLVFVHGEPREVERTNSRLSREQVRLRHTETSNRYHAFVADEKDYLIASSLGERRVDERLWKEGGRAFLGMDRAMGIQWARTARQLDPQIHGLYGTLINSEAHRRQPGPREMYFPMPGGEGNPILYNLYYDTRRNAVVISFLPESEGGLRIVYPLMGMLAGIPSAPGLEKGGPNFIGSVPPTAAPWEQGEINPRRLRHFIISLPREILGKDLVRSIFKEQPEGNFHYLMPDEVNTGQHPRLVYAYPAYGGAEPLLIGEERAKQHLSDLFVRNAGGEIMAVAEFGRHSFWDLLRKWTDTVFLLIRGNQKIASELYFYTTKFTVNDKDEVKWKKRHRIMAMRLFDALGRHAPEKIHLMDVSSDTWWTFTRPAAPGDQTVTPQPSASGKITDTFIKGRYEGFLGRVTQQAASIGLPEPVKEAANSHQFEPVGVFEDKAGSPYWVLIDRKQRSLSLYAYRSRGELAGGVSFRRDNDGLHLSTPATNTLLRGNDGIQVFEQKTGIGTTLVTLGAMEAGSGDLRVSGIAMRSSAILFYRSLGLYMEAEMQGKNSAALSGEEDIQRLAERNFPRLDSQTVMITDSALKQKYFALSLDQNIEAASLGDDRADAPAPDSIRLPAAQTGAASLGYENRFEREFEEVRRLFDSKRHGDALELGADIFERHRDDIAAEPQFVRAAIENYFTRFAGFLFAQKNNERIIDIAERFHGILTEFINDLGEEPEQWAVDKLSFSLARTATYFRYQNRYEEAVDLSLRGIELEPDGYHHYFNAMSAYDSLDDRRNAAAYFAAFLQRTASDPAGSAQFVRTALRKLDKLVYFLFGRLREEWAPGLLDEISQSVAAAVLPEESRGVVVEVGLKLVDYYAARDRNQEAFEINEAVLRVDPANGTALTRRGGLRSRIGQTAEAVGDYEQLLARQAASADVSGTLENIGRSGLRLLERQDPEGALRAFGIVLSRNPEDPHATFYSAVARGRLGQFEEALAGLERAARIQDNPLFGQLSFYRFGLRTLAEATRHYSTGGRRERSGPQIESIRRTYALITEVMSRHRNIEIRDRRIEQELAGNRDTVERLIHALAPERVKELLERELGTGVRLRHVTDGLWREEDVWRARAKIHQTWSRLPNRFTGNDMFRGSVIRFYLAAHNAGIDFTVDEVVEEIERQSERGWVFNTINLGAHRDQGLRSFTVPENRFMTLVFNAERKRPGAVPFTVDPREAATAVRSTAPITPSGPAVPDAQRVEGTIIEPKRGEEEGGMSRAAALRKEADIIESLMMRLGLLELMGRWRGDTESLIGSLRNDITAVEDATQRRRLEERFRRITGEGPSASSLGKVRQAFESLDGAVFTGRKNNLPYSLRLQTGIHRGDYYFGDRKVEDPYGFIFHFTRPDRERGIGSAAFLVDRHRPRQIYNRTMLIENPEDRLQGLRSQLLEELGTRLPDGTDLIADLENDTTIVQLNAGLPSKFRRREDVHHLIDRLIGRIRTGEELGMDLNDREHLILKRNLFDAYRAGYRFTHEQIAGTVMGSAGSHFGPVQSIVPAISREPGTGIVIRHTISKHTGMSLGLDQHGARERMDEAFDRVYRGEIDDIDGNLTQHGERTVEDIVISVIAGRIDKGAVWGLASGRAEEITDMVMRGRGVHDIEEVASRIRKILPRERHSKLILFPENSSYATWREWDGEKEERKVVDLAKHYGIVKDDFEFTEDDRKQLYEAVGRLAETDFPDPFAIREDKLYGFASWLNADGVDARELSRRANVIADKINRNIKILARLNPKFAMFEAVATSVTVDLMVKGVDKSLSVRFMAEKFGFNPDEIASSDDKAAKGGNGWFLTNRKSGFSTNEYDPDSEHQVPVKLAMNHEGVDAWMFLQKNLRFAKAASLGSVEIYGAAAFYRDQDMADSTVSEGEYWAGYEMTDVIAPESRERLKREVEAFLPKQGRILDVMAGAHSAFDKQKGRTAEGIGLSAPGMQSNPSLDAHTVRDLNRRPEIGAANAFDAAVISFGTPYMIRPVELLASVRESLKPGSKVLLVGSTQLYAHPMATAIWLDPERYGSKNGLWDRLGLMQSYLYHAGFASVETHELDIRETIRMGEMPVSYGGFFILSAEVPRAASLGKEDEIGQGGEILERIYERLTPEEKKVFLHPDVLSVLAGAKPAYIRYPGDPDTIPLGEKLAAIPEAGTLGLFFTENYIVSVERFKRRLQAEGTFLIERQVLSQGEWFYFTRNAYDDAYAAKLTDLLHRYVDNVPGRAELHGFILGYPIEDIETNIATRESGSYEGLIRVESRYGFAVGSKKGVAAARLLDGWDRALDDAYNLFQGEPDFEESMEPAALRAYREETGASLGQESAADQIAIDLRRPEHQQAVLVFEGPLAADTAKQKWLTDALQAVPDTFIGQMSKQPLVTPFLLNPSEPRVQRREIRIYVNVIGTGFGARLKGTNKVRMEVEGGISPRLYLDFTSAETVRQGLSGLVPSVDGIFGTRKISLERLPAYQAARSGAAPGAPSAPPSPAGTPPAAAVSHEFNLLPLDASLRVLREIEEGFSRNAALRDGRFVAGIDRAAGQQFKLDLIGAGQLGRAIQLNPDRVFHEGIVVQNLPGGRPVQYILKKYEPTSVMPDPRDPTGRTLITIPNPKNFPQHEIYASLVLGPHANMAEARPLPPLDRMSPGLRAIVQHQPGLFYLVPVVTRSNMPEVRVPSAAGAFARSLVAAVFSGKLDKHVGNFGYAGASGEAPVEFDHDKSFRFDYYEQMGRFDPSFPFMGFLISFANEAVFRHVRDELLRRGPSPANTALLAQVANLTSRETMMRLSYPGVVSEMRALIQNYGLGRGLLEAELILDPQGNLNPEVAQAIMDFKSIPEAEIRRRAEIAGHNAQAQPWVAAFTLDQQRNLGRHVNDLLEFLTGNNYGLARLDATGASLGQEFETPEPAVVQVAEIGEIRVPAEFAPLLNGTPPAVFSSDADPRQVFDRVRSRKVVVFRGDFNRIVDIYNHVENRRHELVDRAAFSEIDNEHARARARREAQRVELSRMMVIANGDKLRHISAAPRVNRIADRIEGERSRLNGHDFLVPVRVVLGINHTIIGGERGLYVDPLKHKIAVHYNVFPPDRRVVNLIAKRLHKLIKNGDTILDMGSGSGVLALIVARIAREKRIKVKIVATDVNPWAIKNIQANVNKLGFGDMIEVRGPGNLFETVQGLKFNLILFNAPWTLGEPKSMFERAIFDQNFEVIGEFMGGVSDYLHDDGSVLLEYSDISDRLGYNATENLMRVISENDLEISRQWDERRYSRTALREAARRGRSVRDPQETLFLYQISASSLGKEKSVYSNLAARLPKSREPIYEGLYGELSGIMSAEWAEHYASSFARTSDASFDRLVDWKFLTQTERDKIAAGEMVSFERLAQRIRKLHQTYEENGFTAPQIKQITQRFVPYPVTRRLMARHLGGNKSMYARIVDKQADFPNFLPQAEAIIAEFPDEAGLTPTRKWEIVSGQGLKASADTDGLPKARWWVEEATRIVNDFPAEAGLNPTVKWEIVVNQGLERSAKTDNLPKARWWINEALNVVSAFPAESGLNPSFKWGIVLRQGLEKSAATDDLPKAQWWVKEASAIEFPEKPGFHPSFKWQIMIGQGIEKSAETGGLPRARWWFDQAAAVVEALPQKDGFSPSFKWRAAVKYGIEKTDETGGLPRLRWWFDKSLPEVERKIQGGTPASRAWEEAINNGGTQAASLGAEGVDVAELNGRLLNNWVAQALIMNRETIPPAIEDLLKRDHTLKEEIYGRVDALGDEGILQRADTVFKSESYMKSHIYGGQLERPLLTAVRIALLRTLFIDGLDQTIVHKVTGFRTGPSIDRLLEAFDRDEIAGYVESAYLFYRVLEIFSRRTDLMLAEDGDVEPVLDEFRQRLDTERGSPEMVTDYWMSLAETVIPADTPVKQAGLRNLMTMIREAVRLDTKRDLRLDEQWGKEIVATERARRERLEKLEEAHAALGASLGTEARRPDAPERFVIPTATEQVEIELPRRVAAYVAELHGTRTAAPVLFAAINMSERMVRADYPSPVGPYLATMISSDTAFANVADETGSAADIDIAMQVLNRQPALMETSGKSSRNAALVLTYPVIASASAEEIAAFAAQLTPGDRIVILRDAAAAGESKPDRLRSFEAILSRSGVTMVDLATLAPKAGALEKALAHFKDNVLFIGDAETGPLSVEVSGDRFRFDMKELHAAGVEASGAVAMLRRIADVSDKDLRHQLYVFLFGEGSYDASTGTWNVGKNLVEFLRKTAVEQEARKALDMAA